MALLSILKKSEFIFFRFCFDPFQDKHPFGIVALGVSSLRKSLNHLYLLSLNDDANRRAKRKKIVEG